MADVQTQTPQIEAHALARHVRMSPQKARLVIDLIRGQKVQDALQTLRYTLERRSMSISFSSRKLSLTKARAGSACAPRRWAAHSATRSAPRISGLALPSIML